MSTKAQPFTFERAFDREGPGMTRQGQRKSLSLDEIETLKRDAHAAGVRSGEMSHAKRSADMLAQIGQKIDALGAALDSALQPIRADAAMLAYATALKLTKVLLSREPDAEIKALIARCIDEQKAEPHLVLRVNDQLHDVMRDTVKSLGEARAFGGRIHVIGEPEIPVGDCRIEWADGGLERNLAGALAEIEAVIRNYVTRTGGNPAGLATPDQIMGPASDDNSQSNTEGA